jgi:hypothetical protein
MNFIQNVPQNREGQIRVRFPVECRRYCIFTLFHRYCTTWQSLSVPRWSGVKFSANCYEWFIVSFLNFLQTNAQKISLTLKFYWLEYLCGPGSSVGLATGYGLDGPGVESGWGLYFPHLSRPALGTTRPPVQWVPVLSRGVESDRGVTLTPRPLLVPRSKR